MATLTPACPKCGGMDAKLLQSHNVYPLLASPGGPPASVASTYECSCGANFTRSVLHDSWNAQWAAE